MNLVKYLCLVFVLSTTSVLASQNAFRIFRKIYTGCEDSVDVLKCLKVQAIKMTDRALRMPNIKLIDGVSLLNKNTNDVYSMRSIGDSTESEYSESELMRLPGNKVDRVLSDETSKFIETHQLQINVPELLKSSQESGRQMIEEGRKKMKKYYGPFLAAIAIKGGILAMAYHSIAIVAGKALIIGKIALIISAIIGLKKLVTPEGHEKTTYEIVKHPHVQQSHTYSSSHGEFEGGHESGGQYHRSFNTNNLEAKDQAFRAYIPS